jgi:hypothetical protein
MTHHAFTAASRASRDYLSQRAISARLTAHGTPLLVIFRAETGGGDPRPVFPGDELTE